MSEEIGNKVKILSKALTLFSQRGYDGVGVQEICELAGVTKPTLYHYFGSKLGLLKGIFLLYGDAYFSVMKEKSAYKNDIHKTLFECAWAAVNFAKTQEDFIRLLLALYFSPPQSEGNSVSREYLSKLYALFVDLFTKALVDHGNMRGKENALALSYQGMVNTMIGWYLNDLTKLDDAELRAYLKRFMHGIFS